MLFLEKYGSYYNELDKRTVRDEDYDVLKTRYDIANKLPQIHFTQGNKVWMPIQYIKGTKDNPDFIQNLYHNVFKDIFYSTAKENHELPVAIRETLDGLKTDKELEFASNIIQLFNFMTEDSKATIVAENFREEFNNSHDHIKAFDNIIDKFTFTRKDGTEVIYVLMDLNDTVGENTFEAFLSEVNDIAAIKGEEAYNKFVEEQEKVQKEFEKVVSYEPEEKEPYERASLKGHELKFDFDADNESIPLTGVPSNIKVVEFLGYEDLDGNYYNLEIPLLDEEKEVIFSAELHNKELVHGTISLDGQRVNLKTTWDNLSYINLGYILEEPAEVEATMSNEDLIRSHKDEIKEFLLDIYNKTLPLGIIDTNLKSDFIKVLREVALELYEYTEEGALSFELGLIADLEDGHYLDAILVSSTYHKLLQLEGKTYSDDILYRLDEDKEMDVELFKGELLQDENNDCSVFDSESESFNSLLPSGYVPTGIKGVFLNTGEYLDAKYHPLHIINLGKDEDQVVIHLNLTKEGADNLHLVGTFDLIKEKNELDNREVRVLLKGSTEIAYVIIEYKDSDFIKEINAMEEDLDEMQEEIDDMGDKIDDLEKRINSIEEGMSSTIGEALEESNSAIEDDSADPVEELLNSSPTEEVPSNIIDTIKPKNEAVAVNPKAISVSDFIQGKIGGYDSNGTYKVYEVYANVIDGRLQITSLEIKEDK